MLKFVFSTLVCLLCITYINAQNNVGIGTNTPDPSAKLDISSSNMGLLIPRVSLSNVSTWGLASGTGTNGMIVYNTNASVTGGYGIGFYLWNGSWTKLANGPEKVQNGLSLATTAPNASASDPYIELGGNLVRNTIVTQAANTLAFTTTATNGFSVDGTTLSVDGANDRVGIGTSAPTNTVSINNSGTTPGTLGTYPLSIQRAGTTDYTIGSDASFVYEQSWNSKPLLLNSQGNNIGIAYTTTPAEKLSINGNASLTSTNTIEFGKSVASKEANAGKIGYQTFTTGALDIVGAGTASGNRLVKLWDNITISGLSGTGNRPVYADASGNIKTLTTNVVGGTGTLNYVPKWTPDGTTLGNSQIFDNGTNVGIGTATPTNKLDVAGILEMNDFAIQLRGGADANHQIIFNSTVDGPSIEGCQGIQFKKNCTAEVLGVWNTTALDVQNSQIYAREGIKTRKSYQYFRSKQTEDNAGTTNLGNWDLCYLAGVSFYMDNNVTWDLDDQCNVYMSTEFDSYFGDGPATNSSLITYQYNAKPYWKMYTESYIDNDAVYCGAICINFE